MPENKPARVPSMPDHPCDCCGSRSWWWRKPYYAFGEISLAGEWLCGVCTPNPNEVKHETKS